MSVKGGEKNHGERSWYRSAGHIDLYDILSGLGNESGAAAATSGGFLAELLSLF
ncbi:hypothetical protein [Mycobacterium sp.]|uniref:hypothetical protein n=1 Tax=Mycobacterium sp. TaxID=1785 RepID=UPI003F99A22B